MTEAAAESSDSVGLRWLVGLLPAAGHALPDTHEEDGSGDRFAFRRVAVGWEPDRDLEDLADNG
ncbi:MAG TPA: hypothetical protein VE270_02100 [Thermoleophilaceae bacterium]|nr:hypothetical protein [Thermoleophilaceae bacterium]